MDTAARDAVQAVHKSMASSTAGSAVGEGSEGAETETLQSAKSEQLLQKRMQQASEVRKFAPKIRPENCPWPCAVGSELAVHVRARKVAEIEETAEQARKERERAELQRSAAEKVTLARGLLHCHTLTPPAF